MTRRRIGTVFVSSQGVRGQTPRRLRETSDEVQGRCWFPDRRSCLELIRSSAPLRATRDIVSNLECTGLQSLVTDGKDDDAKRHEASLGPLAAW